MKKLLPVLVICAVLLSGCSALSFFGIETKKEATATAKLVQNMDDGLAAQIYKAILIGHLDPNQLTDDQIVFLKKLDAYQAETGDDGLGALVLDEKAFNAFKFEISKKEIKDAKAQLVEDWKANFDAKGNVINDMD